jgi:sugar O-acyltransferase (sialic acid O-acetyltransferase NeuD family)
MPRVVILGGKGGGTLAAQIVQDLFRLHRSHELVGYLNDRLKAGSTLYGGPIVGRFDDWRTLDDDICFVAPLHKAASVEANATRIAGLNIPFHRWTELIHPQAIVADDVPVDAGSVISAQSQIGPDTTIGSHCFLRAGAIVSHDVTISDFVYLGQRSIVCGYVKLERGAHIAPGAIIRDDVTVGQFALVGLGAVVTKDVPPFAIVTGSPAQVSGYVEAVSSGPD